MAKPTALIERLRTRIAAVIGEEGVRTVGTATSNIRYRYGTGIPPLDVILSGRVGEGFPGGRACEVYGESNVGKTTLGASVMRMLQSSKAPKPLPNTPGTILIIDTEHTFTQERALGLGLDPNTMIYVEEEYLEAVLDAINTAIQTARDERLLVWWDTIASTRPQADRGRKIGDTSAIGTHARIMSRGSRTIAASLAKSNACILACNQLKVGNVADPFATERERESTLGGKALGFHAEIRLRLEFVRKMRDKNPTPTSLRGFEVRATATKHKSLVQDVPCYLMFSYTNGGRFLADYSCLRTLQAWGAIQVSTGQAGTLTYAGKKYGKSAWLAKYAKDPAFQAEVHTALEETFRQRFMPTLQQDAVTEEDEET